MLAVLGVEHVRQQYIDPVAGVDEARHRRRGRDRHADCTGTGLQYCRHEATRAREHDLAFADRFARIDRHAGDGADEIRERTLAFHDVGRSEAAFGPGLPAQIVRLDDLAGVNGIARDQDLQGWRGGRDGFATKTRLRHDRGALALQPGTGHERSQTGHDDGEQQENDALAVHGIAPYAPARWAATQRPPAAMAGP